MAKEHTSRMINSIKEDFQMITNMAKDKSKPIYIISKEYFSMEIK